MKETNKKPSMFKVTSSFPEKEHFYQGTSEN